MLSTFTFSLDKDIIEIHNHENVKLLCQDLIDIALERGQCVGQSKKYHLVFKMAIVDPKDCFLFIAFFDPMTNLVDLMIIRLKVKDTGF